MMGKINEDNISRLDNKLIEMVHGAGSINGGVYLFTSPTDHQYESEILPNLESLSKLKSFNLILSKSPLIAKHNEVANFNINLLLSLVYQFEHNISPAWGIIHNGSGWNE